MTVKFSGPSSDLLLATGPLSAEHRMERQPPLHQPWPQIRPLSLVAAAAVLSSSSSDTKAFVFSC